MKILTKDSVHTVTDFLSAFTVLNSIKLTFTTFDTATSIVFIQNEDVWKIQSRSNRLKVNNL